MMPNDNDLIRQYIIAVLLVAINAAGLFAGWLFAHGEYFVAVMSEAVAVLAAGWILSETRPQRRGLFDPPEYGGWLLPLPARVPEDSPPCRRLLDALIYFTCDPTPANRADIFRLMDLCDEETMINTANTVLECFESEVRQ